MEYYPEFLPMYIGLYLLVFLLGGCVASFLNVVIYRLPRKMDFLRGRSHCTDCGHALGALDMVPVFSYLFLGRKCRYCGARISPRYAVVELLGGALAVASLAVFGLTWTTMAAFALLAGLLAVAFIDWDTMEIPNGLVIYLALPALALVFLLPGVTWVSHIVGFFAVSVPLLLITLVIQGGFGGGDIKLMAVCGMALGWQLSLLALFIAILTGGGYGAVLLATKKAKKGSHFAFGPFLALGVAVALLFGHPLLDWYFALFL